MKLIYNIEAESTGTHGQFYEKFNIRYEIFQVIKCIWSNDVYKQRLTQESRYVIVCNFNKVELTFFQDEY